MKNEKIVTSYLRKIDRFPETDKSETCGLSISLTDDNILRIKGTSEDLIELSDLLVSIALSNECCGQHWHIDERTLIDSKSNIKELIIEK